MSSRVSVIAQRPTRWTIRWRRDASHEGCVLSQPAHVVYFKAHSARWDPPTPWPEQPLSFYCRSKIYPPKHTYTFNHPTPSPSPHRPSLISQIVGDLLQSMLQLWAAPEPHRDTWLHERDMLAFVLVSGSLWIILGEFSASLFFPLRLFLLPLADSRAMHLPLYLSGAELHCVPFIAGIPFLLFYTGGDWSIFTRAALLSVKPYTFLLLTCAYAVITPLSFLK